MKPKDLGLPTEAYISVEEVHDVSHLLWAGDWVSKFLGEFGGFLVWFGLVFHVQFNKPFTLYDKEKVESCYQTSLEFLKHLILEIENDRETCDPFSLRKLKP